MTNLKVVNHAPLAAGLFGLGVVCWLNRDFALQWQSAPGWLKSVPGAVLINAAWLMTTGVALVIPRIAFWGAISAVIQFAVWSIVFHGPLAFAQPDQIFVWLGVCEVATFALAGLAIVTSTADEGSPGRRVGQAARIGFGICALVFGISHFAYIDVTAQMVPTWLGAPKAWAYLTGAGHVAAGLALVSGVTAKLAAGLEACMCAAFVLLLHLPRVVANPTSQLEWTMLFIATAISGAAWVIRNQVRGQG